MRECGSLRVYYRFIRYNETHDYGDAVAIASDQQKYLVDSSQPSTMEQRQRRFYYESTWLGLGSSVTNRAYYAVPIVTWAHGSCDVVQ